MWDKVYNIVSCNAREEDLQREISFLREFAEENGILSEFEEACREFGVNPVKEKKTLPDWLIFDDEDEDEVII